MYKILFSFCIFLTLIGCNCDECIKCEGLSEPAVQLLDSKINGSSFTNGSDSIIKFMQVSYYKSETYMANCFEDPYSGACDCESDAICNGIRGSKEHVISQPLLITETRSASRSWLVTDSSGTYRKDSTWLYDLIIKYNNYTINYFESRINFNFLDAQFYASLELIEGKLVFKSDSLQANLLLHPSFSTPLKTYKDVLEVINPDQYTSQESIFFNKIYFERLNGVIAFESKRGELFYLSN